MMHNSVRLCRVAVLSVAIVRIAAAASATDPANKEAARILDAAGVQGGLVVHMGCGDGSSGESAPSTKHVFIHSLNVFAKGIAL